MNLRKIISKVVTTALIVTTVGVVQPAKAYAEDVQFEKVIVNGTSEWAAGEDFSARFTVASDPVRQLSYEYALYDDSTDTRVFHSTENQKYKLDKTKSYRLEVYVSGSYGDNEQIYFDGVNDVKLNGFKLYHQSGSISDSYWTYGPEGGSIYLVKKLKYVDFLDTFMMDDNYIDVGSVLISGTDKWKDGEKFDASGYTVSSTLNRKLALTVRLYDDGVLVYDSETKKTPVTLDKNKVYRRDIFIHYDTDDRPAIGAVSKVFINGVEYEYDVIDMNFSIMVQSELRFHKAAGGICYLPDYVPLGVVTVEGQTEWNDKDVFAPKFVVTTSEGITLEQHIRLYKDGKCVYDSDSPKDYVIEEGKTYEIQFLFTAKDSDDPTDGLTLSEPDAVLVNGKSNKNFRCTDMNYTLLFTETFVAGKAKPVEVKPTTDTKKDDAKKDQPKVTAKKTQEVKIKVKAKTIKAKKAKKNLKIKKVFTIKGAQGTVSYQINKAKLKKQFKINKKGIITLKKKLKKGTYKVKVKVIVAGNNEYEDFSKVVTVKIKVK